jgi:hypothetical protein
MIDGLIRVRRRRAREAAFERLEKETGGRFRL